ncbi:50S ribosomal protein L5 [Candidatus Micrarchaeota archaeon CG08_land_8_20_14_0_20_59_11]|nr:MAG: 50S ribosomal protein L5 [Candidatus Micrarchaeota archaeon CG08_land_8_20_14_0_20_59_11]
MANVMQRVVLEKLTLNIGVGEGGDALENGRKLIEKLSGSKAVITLSQGRNPTFKIKKGDPLGVKTTLRGASAEEFLKKALEAVEHGINERSMDGFGNVAFGVKEYIDFPGAKYDPKIGMLGFDVCISLRKPGARIARRRIATRRLPKRQRVSNEEAKAFLSERFGVKFVKE